MAVLAPKSILSATAIDSATINIINNRKKEAQNRRKDTGRMASEEL